MIQLRREKQVSSPARTQTRRCEDILQRIVPKINPFIGRRTTLCTGLQTERLDYSRIS